MITPDNDRVTEMIPKRFFYKYLTKDNTFEVGFGYWTSNSRARGRLSKEKNFKKLIKLQQNTRLDIKDTL